MSYAVKETFYTLQGEGHHAGRPAVFLRFAGCNLWSGRERDRARATCSFCDTDFVGTDGPGGGRFADAGDLARHVRRILDEGAGSSDVRPPLVVCTGGEPLLQIDAPLIEALHAEGLYIAVETNGTIEAPDGLDWICVSPKAGADLVQTSGDELKLVYRQDDAPPEAFEHLDFDHFYLQPMDGPDLDRLTSEAVRFCLRNPRWSLSIQTHKLLGIP
ncbi:MAG: 7-carboxy-7-deazaguanine synthase [Rhodothermales bacterium]|nr:7-carboxy-7-deazaguanine synthase [Rhodothermales bacterium]